MNKILIAAVACLSLTACWNRDGNIRTEIKEVPVAVAYVPKPPTITRPVLATDQLTEEQKKDAGQLVKAHRVALQQTISYSSLLENVIAVYAKLHEETKIHLESLKDVPVVAGSGNVNTLVEIPDFSNPVTHYQAVFYILQKKIDDAEKINYLEGVSD